MWCVRVSAPCIRLLLPLPHVRRPRPEPLLSGFGGIPWVLPHSQGVRHATMEPAAGWCSRCRNASCVRVNTRTDYILLPLRPARSCLALGCVVHSPWLAALATVAFCVLLLFSPELSLLLDAPAGYAAGWCVCVHVSHSGCDHVGRGQQEERCKYGWDGDVTSARREQGGANW